MKKAVLVGILAVLALIPFFSCAYADGMMIPDHPGYKISEPEQQAVIFWDGQKETMVLSTKIESANTINLAWIIPIQSSTTPEVTGGTIGIFRKFEEFFYGETYRVDSLLGMNKAEAGVSGVTVIERKEINIYDLVTLQASNARDLVEWLRENGYSASDDMIDVLDDYVGTKYYFIANKIDLGNWHKTAMGIVEDHDSNVDEACGYGYDSNYKSWGLDHEGEKSMKNLCDHANSMKTGYFEVPIIIGFTPEKPHYPLKPSSKNPGHTTITVYVASSEPMVDSFDLLTLEGSKKVTPEFKNDLYGTFDIGNAAYVTKLRYSGDTAYLNQDAVFRVEASLIEIDYNIILLIIGVVVVGFLLVLYFKPNIIPS
ncbi:MAG: DUF2330 domain-containing protein [Candidatus Altiarchaeota archaeon]|nr:DUF2330 domain-containing protein [Candidatus Altiarchaeota archaeon]